MARQPMVTRTIQTTQAVLLCVDTASRTTTEKVVVLPRTYKNNDHILKAAEAQFSGTELKPVHVLSAEVKQTLYGMKETEFVSLATPIEKPVKSEDETCEFDDEEAADSEN